MRDERGMTLIEVLMALMLLAIVSLALIQSSLVAMKTNVINELRDEGVRVAEERMNKLRITPFNDPSHDMDVTYPGSVTDSVTRRIRAVDRQYTISKIVSKVDDNNRQVTLKVTWSYGTMNYQHVVSTIVRAL